MISTNESSLCIVVSLNGLNFQKKNVIEMPYDRHLQKWRKTTLAKKSELKKT